MTDKDGKLIYEAYEGSVTPIPNGTIGIANTDLMNMIEWYDHIGYMSTDEAAHRLGEVNVEVDVREGDRLEFVTSIDLEEMDELDELFYLGKLVDGPHKGVVSVDDISHKELLKYFDFGSTAKAKSTLRRLR